MARGARLVGHRHWMVGDLRASGSSQTHALVLISEKPPQGLSEPPWSAKKVPGPITGQYEIYESPRPPFSKRALDLTFEPEAGHGSHFQPRTLLPNVIVNEDFDAPGY